jgi:hypothetical protein
MITYIAIVIIVVLLAASIVIGVRIQSELELMRRSASQFLATFAEGLAASMKSIMQLRHEELSHRHPPRAIVGRGRELELISVGHMLHCHGTKIIPPGSSGHVLVMPLRSNYCTPKAVSIFVHAEGWPAIEQRALVKNVYINQNPQLQQDALTDQFAAPSGFGIPVEWAPFSIDALLHPLCVEVENINRCGIQVYVFVWGEMADMLAGKRRPGEPLWQFNARLHQEALAREAETNAVTDEQDE